MAARRRPGRLGAAVYPAGRDPKAVARQVAEAAGCNCRPEITLARRYGVAWASVSHDSWCRLLAALNADTN